MNAAPPAIAVVVATRPSVPACPRRVRPNIPPTHSGRIKNAKSNTYFNQPLKASVCPGLFPPAPQDHKP